MPSSRTMSSQRPTPKRGCVCSQGGVIPLPWLLQFCHESDESLILPQAIQVGVDLEPGIAWKAVIGGGLQPFDGFRRPIEQRIRRSDVVGRMMKMTEAFPNLDGVLDRRFCLTFL